MTQQCTPTPHLGVLLARALTAFTDDVHAELAELGFGDISFVHGSKVFVFLDEQGATLSDLARSARVSRQAMSQMVAQLVARGYVELAEDERDARAKRARLTERGWAAKCTAQPLFAAQERRWAERFGDEPLSALRHILERVASTGDRSPATAVEQRPLSSAAGPVPRPATARPPGTPTRRS